MLARAMVVQIRRDAFRVIRQHDHAIASGVLAAAWIGTGARPAPLAFEAVLGIALHDCAWRDADAAPRRDPATGAPLSFLEHPREERLRFYAEGIDAAERIHPYAGLLASFHYAGFARDGDGKAFVRSERERQARLCREIGIDGRTLDALRVHRLFVTLFDDLSLFACLAGPESLARPSWLLPGDVANVPDGARLRLSWRDGGMIAVDPFPFREAVDLAIPARDLPRIRYEDDAALRRTWEGAAGIAHRVRFLPAG
ncbi:MAG: DUF3891 family protein [bacterium]